MNTSDAISDRLEDQIGWYDKKSISNQRAFKALKVITIIAAATVTLSAAYEAPPLLTAMIGAMIFVVEGLQALNQYQQNWIIYRSTCEELKHEKYLCLAKAGPYSNARKPEALLAERVESLVSREHAKWRVGREQTKESERRSSS